MTRGKLEDLDYVEGSEKLKPYAEKLRKLNYEVPGPDDGIPLRIVRRGILLCGASGCDFTFLLPDSGPMPQGPVAAF